VPKSKPGGKTAPSHHPSRWVALDWSNARENPRRRRISHGIRYGFIAGLGGEPASPAWSSPDYVAAYEAAWELGNAIAIEADPRG
jgi:hypothetical protein